MRAILFGSIGTVMDASELQRHAFNDAFAEHGLDWQWDHDCYRALLVSSGGTGRVAAYARERGVTVDAPAVHATKTIRFHELLGASELTPRPGVAETIDEARRSGIAVALVTTTSPGNVAAVLDALAPQLGRDDFDVVVDSSQVDSPKPAPDAYLHALTALGEGAPSCVAVEDNVGGVMAASAAGLACIAFPNANTQDHDFGGAIVVERINTGVLHEAGARNNGRAPA
ncbi:MAG: HAD-IA family hydrolase [Actinobacteria bacterium]|nr:HAD-IA family hydrolase [Actinomycetota bacterium]